MNARRLTWTGLTSLCVLCASLSLMFTCVSAQAAVIHNYLSQITEVPASSGAPAPGPLTVMESMTFDSGHLWIAETTNDKKSRVDEFDASSGAFISQIAHSEGAVTYGGKDEGIAVGHQVGETEIYVAESNVGKPGVAVFDEAGARRATWTGLDTPEESFGAEVKDIAVDNSTSPADWAAGDVYVAAPGQKAIDVLRPEADGKEKYVTQLHGISPSEPFGYPSKMAVNQSNGDLLVLNFAEGIGAIDVFEPTVFGEYAFVKTITGPPPGNKFNETFNLAVDSSNGDIYVTDAANEGSVRIAIDQFSASGEYLGRITGVGSPAGSISDVYSLTVGTNHQVYVADKEVGVDIFGAETVVPDVTTGSVSNEKPKSVTLAGTVNPDEAGAATCEFAWGTTPTLGHTQPCSAPVANSGHPVAVEVQLDGLEPDATYYYELQAGNANGTNPGESWQIRQFTTPGPRLVAASVSDVTAEAASFDFTILPHGAPTSAYFEYGTTSNYGSTIPAAPGVALGAGEADVEVSERVQGLQANTTYHYRVVYLAEVEPGNVEELLGPDLTLTTQRSGGSSGLPDGRSWELVTPPDKHGALFYGQSDGLLEGVAVDPFVAEASVNGNAMIDLASQPTEAEPQGYANEESVLSTRGAGGWSSQVIATPHDSGTGPSLSDGGEYRFFSEDLSRGVVEPFGSFTPLSPEAMEATPYLRTDYLGGDVNAHCLTSCYQPLVTASNTDGVAFGGERKGECSEHPLCGPEFIDATPDASHVVFRADARLTSTPNQEDEEAFYYEWGAGQLQPLYLLPEAEGGGGVYVGELSSVDHQLANNGSVFFSYQGHLYLHDFAQDDSVRLDVAQGVQEPGEGDASLLYASSDGSKVLFRDPEQLTAAAGGGVYECRIVEATEGSKCELELTGLSETGSFIGGSEDASYLYLANTERRLVVDHYDGHRWVTTEGPFIGTQPRSPANIVGNGDNGSPVYRVSADGRYLTFMSNEDLTGYDTHDAGSGQPDQEVYLYDAVVNRLVCASCNPTGARPTGIEYNGGSDLVGGSVSSGRSWIASNLPPWTRATTPYVDARSIYQPRFLDNSGRLFFDSADALVPQDVNGTEDVYEYEPAGVGDCAAANPTYDPGSGGCVDLISSGASPEESAFMDASATGGDVFFITLAKLVPQDYDNALDVYDAHECSSATPCFPVTPQVPPACSTGDACKAGPSPQPSIFGSAPSATFSGAGNIAPSSPVAPVVKAKSLTRKQLLTRALKACHKVVRKRRAKCERVARKRYAVPRKTSHQRSAKRKGGR